MPKRLVASVWPRQIVFALIAALFVTSGCAASRDSSLKQDEKALTQATEKGELAQALEAADAQWEKRGDKDGLTKAINMYEAAVKVESPNLSEAERKKMIADTYVRLARAYYFFADGHLSVEEEDDELSDEKMKMYEKGVTSAEKAIALLDPEFAAKDESDWQENVGSANPDAIPAFYWYATNLGRWALLEGIATILARKDDVKATMDWMVKEDETFFYAAPHRYFGVYHTKVPLGGGAPEKSKESFDKAIEIAPEYLATKVLKASAYAVLVGDRELFESLLTEVVNAPPSNNPDIEPENAQEKKKAKRLLDQADDLFY